MTFTDIRQQLQAGKPCLQPYVQSCLANIELHRSLNAYVETYADDVLAQAAAIDAIAQKDPDTLLPLHGLVISVKDNICQTGKAVTAASKILEGYVSPFTATALQRLLDQGAIVIGRTNCDEFGMGSASEFTVYGAVRNAQDNARIAGGSSGGAAVALQINSCHLSLGSDTGGSVRQPAAYCGLFGFKPTYGALSRYGLIAYASSFDQIGVLTHDAAIMVQALSYMAGPDEYDATALPTAIAPTPMPKQVRVAWLMDALTHEGLSPEIANAHDALLAKCESLGFSTQPCQIPMLSYAIPTYYILTTAEASSNLARYDGVRYGYRAQNATSLSDLYTQTRSQGFGAEVKRRIMMGNFVLSAGYHDAYFVQAQRSRRLLLEQVMQVFENADVLLLPTTPMPARLLGEQNDPIQEYLADIFTVLANLCGLPAISIPCGTTSDGLHIGMQLMGKPGSDFALLDLAERLEA